MNANDYIVIFMILIALYLLVWKVSKKEGFVQGYDYPISGCIQKCEMDLLRNNPYYVPLQEGWLNANKICRELCVAEYNRSSDDKMLSDNKMFSDKYQPQISHSLRPISDRYKLHPDQYPLFLN